MRARLRWLIAGSLLVLLLALGWWGVIQATQYVPDFYHEALAAEPGARQAQSEQFERQALALQNALYHEGAWEVEVSDEQVNAWLGTTLAAQFPKALSRGVSEPRIAFDQNQLRAAVRYRWRETWVVVSLAGAAYLTPQPNEIAFRLERARAGRLPLPLNLYRDDLSRHAARLGLALRWTEADGLPVAVLRLPPSFTSRRGQALTLDRLHLASGRLTIAGSTAPIAAAADVLAADNLRPAPPQGTSETRQR